MPRAIPYRHIGPRRVLPTAEVHAIFWRQIDPPMHDDRLKPLHGILSPLPADIASPVVVIVREQPSDFAIVRDTRSPVPLIPLQLTLLLYMRERGVGVIHGGVNSLRFTPHFNVTSAEVDLIVSNLRKALLEGPCKVRAEAA